MLWSSYKRIFPKISIYTAPFVSGVLLGTGYIPFPPVGAFIAFVPLWLFIFHQKNLKTVLIGAWLCQFIATLIGFNWLAYTIHTFGDMPWLVSLIGLLFFASFSNIFIVFASGLWFLLIKKLTKQQVLLKLTLLPVLFSLLHSLTPNLFPWNLGYVWMVGFPALQTAEIWGFRFLNTLFYVFNLLFLILYQHKWDSTGRKALAGAFGLFLFLNLFGFYLKKRVAKGEEQLNVILVQNNIGQLKNLKTRDPARRSYRKSKRLTYQSLFRARKKYKKTKFIDFILWPEGAYPYLIPKEDNSSEPLSSFVSRLKIPILTGGSGKEGSHYTNSLFVFNRNGKLQKPIYDKVKLLAFGEYLPLADQVPFIKKFFPYFVGRFKKGEGSQVVQLESKKIGVQICYESLFDYFTRDLARKEAQILVNITNDSWYGSWQQPWQHLFMSLARAIELRRPLLRATNTGFSTVIQADGTIMKRSPLNKSWQSFYTVPYSKTPPQTLFMTWGFYINEIFLLLLVLLSYIPFLSSLFKKEEVSR